jgi:hypothetical protein
MEVMLHGREGYAIHFKGCDKHIAHVAILTFALVRPVEENRWLRRWLIINRFLDELVPHRLLWCLDSHRLRHVCSRHLNHFGLLLNLWGCTLKHEAAV